ncbi:tetratricopeptide repeat protein [Streptomyces sp. bgisy126]|uniref:tetratricopeptide repeat protein n=1 Tax=unclassified Streptomyces TaxID=2593676 RepID=UPI003EB95E0D
MGGSGSGYLIGPRLVLTALHVVHDDGVRATGATVWVGHPRADTGVHKRSATVLWPGHDADPDTPGVPDVALLRLDQDADAGFTTAVRWGRPKGGTPLAYSGIGIPAFSTRTGGAAQYENLRGELAPLTTAGRRWVLDCGVWPAAAQQKERPWAGASGTAVFTTTSGHLVGVTVEYGTGMGERRLTAEPVHLLLDDPGFAVLLAEHAFPGTRHTADDITAPAGEGAAAVWPRQFGTVPELAIAYQHRDAVDQLAAALAGGDATIQADPSTTSGDAAAVVTGLGGVGKTQLAVHHIQQVRHASGLPVPVGSVPASAAHAVAAVDLLLWITASDAATVTAAYAQAAQELGKAGIPVAVGDDVEQAAQGFLTWLQSTHQQWLVVLDDVPDAGTLRGLWPPVTPTGRTLITTRNRDAALTEERRQISVGLFTPDEAVHYLRRRLAGTGIDPSDAELRELADDFGHLPLALAQAASYIRENALTIEEYRAELAEVPLDEALPGIEGLPDRQSHTVTAAWTLSVDYANTLTPAGLARPLLHVLALLDPNSTPAGITAATVLQEHLQQTRDAETDTSGRTVTQRDVKRALRVLHRLHLTDITTDHTLRTHQLLQRTLRETHASEKIDQLGTVAADSLLETWPERESTTSRHYRAATASLATHTVLRDFNDGGLHSVLFHAGTTLGEAGQAAAAHDHYQHLHATAHQLLGPEHLDTLAARNNLARWRDEVGDPAGAANAYTELLADYLRILGPDHPHTLTTRGNLARWRGEAGDPAGAANAYTELLTDYLRILGPDHPHTLTTRNNLARWRGEAGDPAGAANAYTELLTDFLRILGPDHPHTLATRNNLANWLGRSGDAAGAANAYTELLTDYLRILGPDHPHTLTTRNNLARWRGEAGDPAGAANAYTELLADYLRILGPDHPHTLTTQGNLANWLGRSGDAAGAANAYTELLTDYLRILGPDHPHTLTARGNLARWCGETGARTGAAEAFAELLTDHLRILGPDHPQTLTARGNLARWRGEAGDPAGAAEAYAELLTDYLRILGPDHPQTLTVRNNLAVLCGEAGDHIGAADTYIQLLTDQLRILGPDHPDTLITRNNLANWRGESGDHTGAADTYAELLADRLRILGPDHPDILITRNNLAFWRGESGDHTGAADACAQLLTDQLRILGPDHPHTLLTRYQWAVFIGRSGNPADAVAALQELTEDEVRIYGSRDHAEVLNTLTELERWQAVLDAETET